jgi:probable F420-dependent oxidoreductase
MEVGLAIPEQLIGFDPFVLRDYAVRAEELGFFYLTVTDHVLGATHELRNPPFPSGGVYTEAHVFHEPLTLFAFLAAVTNRLELVTAVLVLPQRQTALVAKQAAEVALLSNYRLRMGVGSGWNYVEYESLGTEFETRGHRLEEQVTLLRRLWCEPLLDVDTEFHRIDRAGINPRLEKPVPIWFGGFSAVQQDRCARVGDGMLWSGDTSLSRRGNDAIRAAASNYGRDPAQLGFQATVVAHDGESIRSAIRRWDEAGGTHATISPAPTGGRGPAFTGPTGRSLIDELPRLRDEVGDYL